MSTVHGDPSLLFLCYKVAHNMATREWNGLFAVLFCEFRLVVYLVKTFILPWFRIEIN